VPLDRRSFLRRTSIALAGGLLVGDEALALFERLTHQKVFALGGLPETATSILEQSQAFQVYMNAQMDMIVKRVEKQLLERFASDYMNLGSIEVIAPPHPRGVSVAVGFGSCSQGSRPPRWACMGR
jgi:hypothetical protein